MTTKTHSIHLKDHKKGRDSELFFTSLLAAANRVAEMHQWAKDNGYSHSDYTITLSEIQYSEAV